MADRWLQAGETLVVPVIWGQNSNLEGWQMGFQTDPALARIEGVEGLPDEAYHLLPDGSLRVLWFGSETPVAEKNTLFYLKINVLSNARLSDALQLKSEDFLPEAYAAGEPKHAIQLRFAIEGSSGAPDGLQLFGPYPNPTNGDSRLELWSAVPSEASLLLFDATGSTIFRQHLLLSAGMQTIALPTADLPAGVLAWRLDTDQQGFSGRLIKQ